MKSNITLADIEPNTRFYRASLDTLKDELTQLEAELAAVRRKRMPKLRQLIQKTAAQRTDLIDLVKAAPGLFVKPRTYVLNGIRIGLAKGKGGITFTDADRVVELIKRHFPGDAGALIHTKETPDKEALAKQPAAVLKRLGVEIVDAHDAVVVKDTNSEIEKAVEALLKDACEETNEERRAA